MFQILFEITMLWLIQIKIFFIMNIGRKTWIDHVGLIEANLHLLIFNKKNWLRYSTEYDKISGSFITLSNGQATGQILLTKYFCTFYRFTTFNS